jgi:hydrogenase maturation protein HypF
MSQHIGDLKNLETLEFYTESVSRFRRLFRLKPSLVACDLHPDYLSTRFAEDLASNEDQIPLIRVQHHHAHIAACMAEYGIDEKVIGISMDGVGYGDDGHSWGFEFFTCDLLDYERVLHLAYTPQPGGDLATHEPWRMALAYLYRYIDKDFEKIRLPFMDEIGPEKMNYVRMALENNINTPLSSSAGRLFDAVAALTGICTRASFHAEAPMRLEQAADWDEKGKYTFSIDDHIHPGPVIECIINDLLTGTPPSVISSRFHRAVTEVIVQSAMLLRQQTGLTKIVLSGGTFQNRFILAETQARLKIEDFEVYIPSLFPVNDGGIALGQLAVAAKRRISGNII